MTPQAVDLLLTNATVVTMDPDGAVIDDGAVAIKGDQIVALGQTADLLPAYQANRTLDCRDTIISPGLINAHTHVPMTLLRGLSDDLRLDVWLYGFMMPVEREFVDPGFSRTGTLLGCAEMIRGGVTTFCDMYYFEDQVAQAAAEAGLRAVCAQTILKFPAPDAPSYDQSLETCRAFIERWHGHPLIIPTVGPHAPYTATPELLRACVSMAAEYDVPLHIHIAETAQEQENSRNEHGLPVVPWLEQYGVFETKVMAAHCVHLDETELTILKKAGAGVLHCPSANLKLASGVAPVHRMLAMGLNLGIGTDGPASNNDLDMFEETRLAALLQKGTFLDPTLLPARRAWEAATIGGARALHLDHLVGSLEVGKLADLIVIDLNASHQTPRFKLSSENVFSQLIYAAKATDVRHVIVNGQLLLAERQLLTLNESALHQEAMAMSGRINHFLASRETNLMSKLLAVNTGVTPAETYEVQVKVKVDSPAQVRELLDHPAVTVTRSSTRNQFDTYFYFEDEQLGRIRHREDEVLEADGGPQEILYRITLIGPTVERTFDNSIMLTRSRYSVPADKSRRFYREYFAPWREKRIEKHRRRYHILYKDTQFVVNLDRLERIGDTYLEIKSRTWSAVDAEQKAILIGELLSLFSPTSNTQVLKEYLDLV